MKKALALGALALVAAPPMLALVIAGAANRADAACSGPVPPSADIDAGTRDAVNALRPTYVAVAQRQGVPWQALAALDYRESANDPDRSALAGEPLGQP